MLVSRKKQRAGTKWRNRKRINENSHLPAAVSVLHKCGLYLFSDQILATISLLPSKHDLVFRGLGETEQLSAGLSYPPELIQSPGIECCTPKVGCTAMKTLKFYLRLFYISRRKGG